MSVALAGSLRLLQSKEESLRPAHAAHLALLCAYPLPCGCV